MKRIYVALNDTEAYVVKAMLEDAGISAVVQGERLEPLTGKGAAHPFPEVWVRQDADIKRITELLVEYERIRKSPSPEETEGAQPDEIQMESKGLESANPVPAQTVLLGPKTAFLLAVLFLLGLLILMTKSPPRKRPVDPNAQRRR